MNELITELAKQAGISTNLETDYFEKDMNKWIDHYSNTFLQLIIQECTAQIAMIGISNFESEDISWTVTKSIEMIKQRFGIE